MNDKMILALREYYDLSPSLSDAYIKHTLKGSLGEAIINIDIAKKNLAKAFRLYLPKVFSKRIRIK